VTSGEYDECDMMWSYFSIFSLRKVCFAVCGFALSW